MKKLKDLKGIEVLSKSKQKSVIGGEDPQILFCYCPGTDIYIGTTRGGESCASLIDHYCPLDS